MPKPIEFTPTPAKIEATPKEELERLLQTLHKKGLLDVANSAVEGSMDGLAVILEKLDHQGTYNALQNAARLIKLLGELNPSVLGGLESGVRAGNQRVAESRPPGLFGLLMKMRNPDVRRGLDIMVGLLQGIGMPPPNKDA